MGKSYIMIIEEGIKSFSLIGHGNDYKISLAVKGQTAPLVNLCAGDKVVGYISNTKKRFAYLFEVQKAAEGNECVIVKLFESATGPLLDSMDSDIKNTIQSREQTESLIAITEEQYNTIVMAMLSACTAVYGTSSAVAGTGFARTIDESKRIKGGTNIILYGVPGCGKSHEIKTKYCNKKKFMERVVFHPDYTYSDFVGQILPKTDGEKISYPFTEGPFTTILRKAIHDPENMYYLVIEEINRGNAPAIFGEVFQLLDRENGESEYGINNFDIAKCIYGPDDAEEEIKLPSNLTILATMNTADQNVFTLDTAFKRRWVLRSIENNIAACDHATHKICGTSITWETFATKINDTIIEVGEGNLSSEDNRLGAYFVKADDLLDERVFAEKVLMYLWNDAFKYDRDKVFKTEYRTLEDLLKGFYSYKFGVFTSQMGFNDVAVQNSEEASSTGGLSEDEYLQNKKSELVELYGTVRDMVKQRVPNLYTYTTNSKQYIGLGSADNAKKSFAEFAIKREYLSLEIEKPTDEGLQDLGEEIEYNGSHDHYFRIVVTKDSDLDLIVAAIVDSYEQLK